ncbi:MAG: NIPSNAP family protein [Dehalococcoidia bacterium]|nr:NIPSNAP family protein [Dehalococcoidia bacterium]
MDRRSGAVEVFRLRDFGAAGMMSPLYHMAATPKPGVISNRTHSQEDTMIYEYRVYEAAPGKLEALNARFRNHTLGIFERHGIKNIGYWTASVGDYSDRLIYIVAFEDEGQRAEAWASFRADPEWNKVRSESEVDGPLTTRITNSILNPTDYSPLQ